MIDQRVIQRRSAPLDHAVLAPRAAATARPQWPPSTAAERPSARADGLGALLARSVQGRVLQRFTVNPVPTMRHQWRFGLGLFFDPNCGWYSQIAQLRQRAAALGLPGDPAQLLPKTTLMAWNPGNQGAGYSRQRAKPADTQEWEDMLTTHGPVVASGKLGGADWGPAGGVGHYILIVGADPAADTLQYKDPLQGNRLKTGTFAHMDPRIDDDVYTTWDYTLTTDLNHLAHQNAPVQAGTN